MDRILLPTDFSDNARNAIDHAIRWFGDGPARFYLLNTYYTPHTSPDAPDTTVQAVEDEIQQQFDRLIAALKGKYGNRAIEFEKTFRYGDFLEIVKDEVDKNSIDLIVMGTQGTTGLERVLLGSYTASVIRHVRCPIIAVPEESKFSKPDHIVFAVNAKKEPMGQVIRPMLAFARKYGSKIIVLHVINGDAHWYEEHELDAFFKGVEFSYETIYNRDVEHGIESYLQKHKAGLLAMVTHDYNLVQRLFHRSLTRKVSVHTKVPLMVMHAG